MRLADAPYTSFACAAWKDRSTLELVIRPLECVCARELTFTFSGNRVKMKPVCDPPIDSILGGVRGLLKSFIKSEAANMLVSSITDKGFQSPQKKVFETEIFVDSTDFCCNN